MVLGKQPSSHAATDWLRSTSLGLAVMLTFAIDAATARAQDEPQPPPTQAAAAIAPAEPPETPDAPAAPAVSDSPLQAAQSQAGEQVAHDAAAQAQEAPAEPMIRLNFPQDLELETFVEYVSRRLDINILYDQEVARRRVTLRSPAEIPESSLLGVLESALKMRGLALVDAEQPGWKKIVAVSDLLEVAVPDGPQTRPTQAVTGIFRLQHASTATVAAVIRPFLSKPGGNSLELAPQRLLVVTDFAANMPRVEAMILLADQPGPPVTVRFIPVAHLEAGQLAQAVTRLISAKARAAGDATLASAIDVSHDPRTNQLVIIATADRLEEAAAIAASLDVDLGLQTRVYRFETVAPDRVERLVRELIDPVDAARLYRSAVDAQAGLLVVTTIQAIHERVAALQAGLDAPSDQALSPVRFYKLKHTSASAVLATIRTLEGSAGFTALRLEDGEGRAAEQGAAMGSAQSPEAAAERAATAGVAAAAGVAGGPPPPPETVLDGRMYSSPITAALSAEELDRVGALQQAVQTTQATVTSDPNTNSIIVIAQPAVQRIYEQLIDLLDRRRPQVLIEATIVTLDTSGDFSLGVEISGGDPSGDPKVLTFSSFGLSEVDPDTGRLSLSPGLGFNGAVLSSDIADIIIRALSASGRAKVISAPKVLVNDNATGTLTSVSESPFTSINQFDAGSSTSFGGYATAGTTITLAPRISEGDYLHLNYAIELSSFAGDGGNGIPPPRQTNGIRSDVAVPNGHTVIVGGLNRRDSSETITRVPLLGDIPLLEYLFSSRTLKDSEATLFVFLRPVILRDEQFEDLRYLSYVDRQAADLPAAYPSSHPLAVY